MKQKHNLRYHPLYSVWANMKTRCTNKHDAHFERWGGRNITVCDEWMNDFKSFYDWAIAAGYKSGLTLDRINNDKGYSPNNCRWITIKEQNQNKRNVIALTYNGKTMSAAAWGKELGLGKNTVISRYHRGWSIEECLFGKKVMQ